MLISHRGCCGVHRLLAAAAPGGEAILVARGSVRGHLLGARLAGLGATRYELSLWRVDLVRMVTGVREGRLGELRVDKLLDMWLLSVL